MKINSSSNLDVILSNSDSESFSSVSIKYKKSITQSDYKTPSIIKIQSLEKSQNKISSAFPFEITPKKEAKKIPEESKDKSKKHQVLAKTAD
jgi:hypothetical protein